MATIKTLETPKTEATQEVANVEISNKDLLNMVMSMQKELQDYKAQDKPTTAKDKKAHYEWPAMFSYKIWDGNAVLDYKSVKKDNTKALAYRSVTGELLDNHLIELVTSEGELKKPVLLYDFNMWFERSEKMTAGARLKDWTIIKELQVPKHVPLFEEVEVYILNTKEHGVIEVSPNIIN